MQKKKSMKKLVKEIRLTRNVIPKNYTISLEPDLEAHVFSGTETIDIEVKKNTKTITLHSKDLEIFDISIKSGKETILCQKISFDQKHESATFSFNKSIFGKIKMTLSFRGILNDSMRGFYKSTYHVDGQQRTMATTQFEANDARRCIPCFDEPNLKATFSVTLLVPLGKEAVSNTLPVLVNEHAHGIKAVTFAKTPIMSTYLLAFLVGDFEYLEHKTKKGVNVRIITTPGKKEQGKFAMDVTLRCLSFYEKYFNIPYPLDTLDMIAIPDFESGAMENWGAITYRETALLVDEENSGLSNKQRVAIVICHELAHQWFGNLVTMNWWNDLWLNEGFASYMEYVAVDALFPEWDIWSQFMFSDHNRALRLDSLCSTHPIEVPVHDPNDIGEIFDAISYSKGAALIRQLNAFIGEENFRKGLEYYLKKHSYKNTETIDLWDAFEKKSKMPVKKFMQTWTTKAGHPVVSVKELNNKIVLSQKRFFSNTRLENNNDKTVWPYSVSFLTDKGVGESKLVTTKKAIIHTPDCLWYKINYNETGFYRTEYSDQVFEKINKALASGRLPDRDRVGIVRDTFALLESGTIPFKQAVSLFEVFKSDQSYIVWVELIGGIYKINRLVEGTQFEESYKKWVRNYLNVIIDFVGFDPKTNEDASMPLFRSLILNTASTFDEPQVVKWLLRLYKNKSINPINPNIKSLVYNGVVMHQGKVGFNVIKSQFVKESNHQEKNRLLQALGKTRDVALIEVGLRFMVSSSVRLQDRMYYFLSVTDTHVGAKKAFVFMKNNWKSFKEISQARNMFGYFIESFSGMKTDKDAQLLKTFLEKEGTLGIEMKLRQTLEKININTDFCNRTQKDLIKWLKNK